MEEVMKMKNVYLVAQDENLSAVLGGYDAAHISQGGGLSRPSLATAFKMSATGFYGPVAWIIRPSGIAIFRPAMGLTRKQAMRLLVSENLQPGKRIVLPLPE